MATSLTLSPFDVAPRVEAPITRPALLDEGWLHAWRGLELLQAASTRLWHVLPLVQDASPLDGLLRAAQLGLVLALGVVLYSGLSLSPAWVFDLPPRPPRPFLRIGHRGAAGLAPENTLSAISAALEHGVDRIEIDVRQTRDGRIVLMHDDSLRRTAGREGLVKDHSYAQLARLDVGRWFSPEFTGERIPTLEDAIALVDGRAELLIEIKQGSDYTPGIERNVVRIIAEHGCGQWCAVHSFHTGVLERIHAIDPSIRLHKLFIGKLRNLPVVVLSSTRAEIFDIDDHPYIEEYSINYHYMNRGIIAKLVARGKKVNVWTVDDPALAEDLLALGVDGIITDRPDRVRASEWNRAPSALPPCLPNPISSLGS